jgi:hypothetical protein
MGCESSFEGWSFKVAFRNSILTKYNLLKRGWVGSEKCRFCCENESNESDSNQTSGGMNEVCNWVYGFKIFGWSHFVASGVSDVHWALLKFGIRLVFSTFPCTPKCG